MGEEIFEESKGLLEKAKRALFEILELGDFSEVSIGKSGQPCGEALCGLCHRVVQKDGKLMHEDVCFHVCTCEGYHLYSIIKRNFSVVTEVHGRLLSKTISCSICGRDMRNDLYAVFNGD